MAEVTDAVDRKNHNENRSLVYDRGNTGLQEDYKSPMHRTLLRKHETDCERGWWVWQSHVLSHVAWPRSRLWPLKFVRRILQSKHLGGTPWVNSGRTLSPENVQLETVKLM